MKDSFEGTFGVQEEFPIGNRDADIDEAIEKLKKSSGSVEFNNENAQVLAGKVLELVDQKHGLPFFGMPIPGNRPEDKKEMDTAENFSSVYNEEAILNRLRPHLK